MTEHPEEKSLSARRRIEQLEAAAEISNRDLATAHRQLQMTQAYLNRIFQSMTDMVFIIDPDSTVRTINLAARVKLGYSESFLVGKRFGTLLDGADPFGPENLDAVLKERQFVNCEEFRCLTQTGRKIPILLTANVIRSEKGAILGLICMARDITDRLQAEDSHRREAAFLDVLQTIALAASQAANLEDAYAACLGKIRGLVRAQVAHVYRAPKETGQPLTSTLLWDLEEPDPAGVYSEFREESERTRIGPGLDLPARAFREGRAVFIPELASDPDLTRAQSAAKAGLRSAFCFPIFKKTEIVAVMEFYSRQPLVMDARQLEVMSQVALQLGRVAERNEAQARLLQSERMASLGSLVASAAHEINNPLSFVIQNIDLIHEELPLVQPDNIEPQCAAISGMLDHMREGADRVRVIVADMKNFSRGEDERYRAVDLHRTLDVSLQMAANQIRHRARLVRRYGTIPAVLADEKRLGQVFLNLLVNAAQAIPEGRADGNEIEVTTRLDADGSVAVLIRDSGKGIPPELLSSIFDPFFTTKPVGEGTGLGLSICQSIVTRMSGGLTVESAVGKGSTFKVTLKPAPGAGSEAQAAPAAPAKVTIALPLPPEAPATRARILIIDDEAVLVEALERALRKTHDVTVRVQAREGLELLLGTQQFDLVLCDLMMPEMTGMEIYAEVRAKRAGLESKIVFMSGGAFTPGASEFLAKAPNPLLQKPFTIASVRSLVQKLLAPRAAA